MKRSGSRHAGENLPLLLAQGTYRKARRAHGYVWRAMHEREMWRLLFLYAGVPAELMAPVWWEAPQK